MRQGDEAKNYPAEYLTPEQAAAILNCSPGTLRKWRCIGGGPPFTRLSKRAIRYSTTDLHEWMLSRRARNTAESARQKAEEARVGVS